MADFQESLAQDIKIKFDKAERDRMEQENVWSKSLHNFRGKYYKDIHFTEHEKSRVFIKVTKTKVLAAYGQMIDLVDNNGRLPITVSKTEVPESGMTSAPPMEAPGMNPSVGMDSQGLPFNVGYSGDGREVPPGATFNTMSSLTVPQEQPPMMMDQQAPQEPDYIEAARKMEKLIHDQLGESDASMHVKDALFESCLMGTGVIKGPFNHNKSINKWDDDGNFTQEFTKVPRIEFVSCWNIYPDPEAHSVDECDWVIQRHKMSRSQLTNLMDQPNFNSDNIMKVVGGEPNYENRTFEMEVEAEEGNNNSNNETRWEVLEYWGVIDPDLVKDMIPDTEINEKTTIHINAWECNGHILRLVLNPFQPTRLPYLFIPYERNPYSIWGVGVAENMEDSQALMNGSARMAIDNAALAGNIMLDVDESALAPGQDMTAHAGKVFVRQTGLPGQAIYPIKIPSTAQENMMMFDRWRQIADESTGIPSYSHGNTGVTGMTRTAAGMSMLMGAANLNIKTAVKNADTYLFGPLGKYFFYWNRQFYSGPMKGEIKGDLEVKAEGSKGLIQKEVKSQRLLTLLQLASNPAIAPMVNIQNLVWDIANTLDADAERYVNSPEQARMQAEIVGMQRQAEAQQQETMANGETGNGDANIGTGKVPQAGEPEFSSNGDQ